MKKRGVSKKRKKISVNSILKRQIEIISPEKNEVKKVNRLTKNFISDLKKEFAKTKYDVQVFVGGSFAKNTLVKKDEYDVDIFVRFPWQYDAISDLLGDVLKVIVKKNKWNMDRVHGSRDYFKIYQDEKIYFEIIPVTKIKKPREERNVTDLSYFHVPYVKRKIKGKEEEVCLAKTFLNAQKVYGAETYIRGFSGYAVECLIIHYGSFLNMLKGLSKVKVGERLVIDIEKKYKRGEVFFDMNENKLHSPVILVDPTYKERNALAALSHETFFKFQKSAKAFLKNPSLKYFEEKPLDVESLKKKAKTKKGEFLHLRLKTDRQAGDIAGTRLKKTSEIILRELERYFKILGSEFQYDDEQNADFYIITKSKKEVVRIGPPLHMPKHVRKFKKEHVNTYEKNKFVHAKIKVNFTAKAYLDVWKKSNKKLLNDINLVGLSVLD